MTKYIYLFIFVVIITSCDDSQKLTEKRLAQISENNHYGKLMFNINIGDPDVVSIAKLHERGLYNQGRFEYKFDTDRYPLKDLKWSIEMMFHNDTVRGMKLNAKPIATVRYVVNDLLDIYTNKYGDPIYINHYNRYYYFKGMVEISISSEKSTYNGETVSITYLKVDPSFKADKYNFDKDYRSYDLWYWEKYHKENEDKLKIEKEKEEIKDI